MSLGRKQTQAGHLQLRLQLGTWRPTRFVGVRGAQGDTCIRLFARTGNLILAAADMCA